jgi:hypothetical protein
MIQQVTRPMQKVNPLTQLPQQNQLSLLIKKRKRSPYRNGRYEQPGWEL